MNRMRELDRLRYKVSTDRQRVEALEARWMVPALAFLSGLVAPPVTGTRSANPIVQLFAFTRRFASRVLRFVVFRNLWEILRRHDAATMAAQSRMDRRRQT